MIKQVTLWCSLTALLLAMAACSPTHSPKPQANGFYTPSKWQQPIDKKQGQRTPKTAYAQPNRVVRLARPTSNGFQPDFKGSPSAVSMNSPASTQAMPSSNQAFSPNFGAANATDQMEGIASWYGPGFHGKKTANGERYNQLSMTAAHKILPLGTLVRVTNQLNNQTVLLRINDRGPYKKNRVLDLSKLAATRLNILKKGTAPVKIEVVRYPKNYDPIQGLKPYKQTVVQVGVFKDRKRAESFMIELEQRFYAYSFFMDKNPNGIFQIMAGPYEKRNQAIKTGQLLKARGLENFVRSYRK